jgi:hypothetical protein
MRLALYDVALSIVCLGGAIAAVRIWRTPPGSRPKGFPSAPPPIWLGNGATWRAAVRSLHCVVAFLSVLAIFGFARLFLDQADAETLTNTVGIPLFSCIAGLGICISLFSRPRQAVPPTLRSEPGILAEWLRRRGDNSPAN